jgi:hypothetical protein
MLIFKRKNLVKKIILIVISLSIINICFKLVNIFNEQKNLKLSNNKSPFIFVGGYARSGNFIIKFYLYYFYF